MEEKEKVKVRVEIEKWRAEKAAQEKAMKPLRENLTGLSIKVDKLCDQLDRIEKQTKENTATPSNVEAENIEYLICKLTEINDRLIGLEGQVKREEKGEFLNVEEVCALTRFRDRTVYRLRCEGKMPGYKAGNGSIFFKKKEIEDWLTKYKASTPEEVNSQAETYTALKKTITNK